MPSGLSTPREGSSNRAIGRQWGRTTRDSYVSLLRQEALVGETCGVGTCLRDRGKRVLLLFASERNADRWWFGVKEEELTQDGGAYVVLLGRQDDGAVLDFVLPSELIKKVLPKLSRSGNQVQFNLNRNDNQYWLKIPYDEPLDVSEYMGARWLLK